MFNTAKTTFRYLLSDEAQKRHLIETGQFISPSGSVKLELTQLTPQQRQRLLDYNLPHNWTGSDFVTYEIERSFLSPPRIVGNPVRFDAPPTVEEIFAHLDRMTAEYPAAQAQLASLVAEHKAKLAAEEAKREAAREREREAAERARQQATIIPWKEDGTAIVDLEAALFAASGDDQDRGGWILEVSGIDPANKQRMFLGEYVEEGTVEVKRQRRVYLVASKSGSRKYQTTTYRVVVMTELGLLERTDITTDDDKPGWQLRIRDQVAELLK
jgi:hypothetical protein